MKKLYSIFRFKCPRCLKGKFFKSHPYNLKETGNLEEKCSHCQLKYEREVGFYFGALFVSYALAVALFVTCWVSFNLFYPQASVWLQIGVICFLSIVTAPLLYALSKIIWINLFVSFAPEKQKTPE